MKNTQVGKANLIEVQAKIVAQFQGLNPSDPSQWPLIPRFLLLCMISAGVVVSLWFIWLSPVNDELDFEVAQEIQLRADYSSKLAQSINIEELKKQLEQVRQYVAQLEKQLPSKAEMDALLSDINQAGLGRSLQFEMFKPGQVIVRDYYAELPIAIKVTGAFHDVAQFSADIAHLSRIVTLNNISLIPFKEKSNMLIMEGTAKTFRYLDSNEVAAQKKILDGKERTQ